MKYKPTRVEIAMLLLAAVLAILALSCKPRVEYVPTPCPPPPMVLKPVLPISSLKPDWTLAQREAALWSSLALAVGYATSLERIVDAYRPKEKVK